MTTFQDAMLDYRDLLQKGSLQQAYRGLMDYMQDLKTFFKNQHPDFAVPGTLYFGYMDMTYFALNPPSLKERGLKIALVYLHEDFRFEVWLSGYNRQVQARYWQVIQHSGWTRYPLVPDPKGEDAIITCVLADPPDFSDLPGLTRQLEAGTLAFIADVQAFLAQHPAD